MIDVVSWAAYAPVYALAGALVNAFIGKRLKESLSGWIASGAIAVGFVLSFIAFVLLLGREEKSVHVPLWSYLTAGEFKLELGFTVDTLSILMMLIITGVGLLIHIYSMSYMHGDEGYSRYFSFLNLFVAAMLVLVLADSFFLMFIGWEGVGVCSYLLIGFWFSDKFNADAARKAFIVNRIGDVGFLLGMFLTFKTFGTLNIAEVNDMALTFVFSSAAITGICLFYLLAACGKSAQLPLQTWLPDAMAGPTPVSALIHAATMVTAGVYLIARVAPLFAQSPAASATVAWVGALTAFVAAFAALSQMDIKKILAYSTISQLGFMFAAVGAGAYWVGIFHVFTHAFFKALLFLASGSVIHALGGEQNIEKMGGLGKHMRITGLTALIGTLTISGVPFLAGFFSKDAILAHIFNSELIAGYRNGLIYWLLLITAGMTAFYMFRWYYRVFAGEERFGNEARAQLHESPSMITTPLVILAFFSIFAGYVGIPEFLQRDSNFYHWLQNWLAEATLHPASFAHPSLTAEWIMIGLSVLAAAVGLWLGFWMYHLKGGQGFKRAREGALARFSASGVGFDGLYKNLFTKSTEATSESFAVVDKDLVDQGLRFGFGSFGALGNVLRLIQTGFVRAYALAMLLGVALIALLVMFSGVLS